MYTPPPKHILENKTHLKLKDIADEFKVSVFTVRSWFIIYGILKPRCSPIAKPPIHELEALIHVPLRNIAKQYNVSQSKAYSWFVDYNINKNPKNPKPSKEQLEELSHLTRNQIAKHFNVTRQCVSLWCKEYNLKFKKSIKHNYISMPSIEELNDTLTIKQKIDKFKASRPTIVNWLKYYDIYPNQEPLIDIDKIKSLIHLPQKQIAKNLKISQQYVSCLIKKHNLKP